MNTASNISSTGEPFPQPQPELYGVINIQEINRSKEIKREDENLWYNKLIYWVAISLVISGICLIIAYFLRSFLFITPLFPIIAVITWSVRKILRDTNLDKEEWLK